MSHPSESSAGVAASRVAIGGRSASRRDAYATADLTEGNIPRKLWFLAWPQMVEQALTIVDQLMDIFWAGHMGAKSIAGLGVAQSYSQLAMTGRMGFDTAQRAMVGRAIGAGDLRTANHVALQAFTLSAVYSVLTMIIGVALTEPMMRLLGVSEAVIFLPSVVQHGW